MYREMPSTWSLCHGVDFRHTNRVKAVRPFRCTKVIKDCDTTHCAYSLWLGAIFIWR